MYKCINNSAPDYLCNLFDMNTNSNVYSLRSSACPEFGVLGGVNFRLDIL
jgi:hypothetical protein